MMSNKYTPMKAFIECFYCKKHKQCTNSKIGYICDNCLKMFTANNIK